MIQRTPVFSVVIPTRDRRALVARAVASVLNTTLANVVEIIVVDDGSRDGTVDFLRHEYAQDVRVKLLRLDSTQGPSTARNHGFAAATGEYVLFLDSDDVLLPFSLAVAQAAFAQFTELQFVGLEGSLSSIGKPDSIEHINRAIQTGWREGGFKVGALPRQAIAPPAGWEGAPPVLEYGNLLPFILFGDLFFLSGLFMRRNAVISAGSFNPRFRYSEDWDFEARLCLTGPGGYLNHIGFHREAGRADQLYTLGTPWRRATMHHHVLDTLSATGGIGAVESSRTWRRARSMANYDLGCALLERNHPRRARAHLLRAFLHAYKPSKSLALIVAGKSLAKLRRTSRPLPRKLSRSPCQYDS